MMFGGGGRFKVGMLHCLPVTAMRTNCKAKKKVATTAYSTCSIQHVQLRQIAATISFQS